MTFRGGAGDQAHGTCGCEHSVFGLFQGSQQVPPTTRQDRNTRVNYNYMQESTIKREGQMKQLYIKQDQGFNIKE